MKCLLFGLAATVLLSGCSMTHESEATHTAVSDSSGDYAVHIIVANIQGDGLTELMPELFRKAGSKSIGDMEVFSSKSLFSPEGEFMPSATAQPREALLPKPEIEQATIDRILAMPEAAYEYPILYATPGKTVICDQTEEKEFLADVEVVDGQSVKTMKTVKLGHYAEITLKTTANTHLTCDLKVENKSLFGTETHTLENGDQVEIPYFDAFSISSAAIPVSEAWTMQALSVGEETQNGITTGTAHLIFIRAVPDRPTATL